MPIVKEWKEFAVKGNVVDLAVGIIIGTAFGAVVRSLVDDIIMPIAGLFLGGVDLSERYFVVRGPAPDPGANVTLQQAREAGGVIVTYGNLLNLILTFIIVAWAVFFLVKAINRMKRPKNVPPGAPDKKDCPFCHSSIHVKATRCPNCTSELPAAAKGSSTPSS